MSFFSYLRHFSAMMITPMMTTTMMTQTTTLTAITIVPVSAQQFTVDIL